MNPTAAIDDKDATLSGREFYIVTQANHERVRFKALSIAVLRSALIRVRYPLALSFEPREKVSVQANGERPLDWSIEPADYRLAPIGNRRDVCSVDFAVLHSLQRADLTRTVSVDFLHMLFFHVVLPFRADIKRITSSPSSSVEKPFDGSRSFVNCQA
jgi:hypothetical protein